MQRRFPVGVLALVPIIVGFGVYAFTTGEEVPTPTPGVTASPVATETPIVGEASSTATPPIEELPSTPIPPPAPVSEPTPITSHGSFHAGARVRVNAGEGDCLNARAIPTLDEQYNVINLCLPHGHEGVLAGSPIEADGHWWWMLAGAGYVVEEFLVYVGEWADAPPPPALAESGHIAFVREGAIWVMNADGTGQREVFSGARDDGFTVYPTDLNWSPDGTRVSFNIPRWSSDGRSPPAVDMHIVGVDGSTALVVPGVAGRGWSPDGARIGIVEGAQPQQMGGGWQGYPGWVDTATGAIHRSSNDPMWETAWQHDPPAFNHDGTLMMLTAGLDTPTGKDRSIRILDLAGVEIARIVEPTDDFYYSPRWSPTANRISFHISTQDRPRYAVYDLAAGRIIVEAAVPAPNPNAGGRCGGADMWRSEWSRDGERVLYSFTDGLAGTNGVWSWNITTGEQRVIPAFGAGAPSAGPDGFVAFSSGEHIVAGSVGGGLPVPLASGFAPAWSPAR